MASIDYLLNNDDVLTANSAYNSGVESLDNYEYRDPLYSRYVVISYLLAAKIISWRRTSGIWGEP